MNTSITSLASQTRFAAAPARRRAFARTVAAAITLTLFAAMQVTTTALAQGEVRVYAVVNEDDVRMLAERFTAETGIAVQYLRAATGELVTRVMAEAQAPQADVLLGGPSSQHIAIAESGALAAYTPAAAGLPDYAVSPDGTWNGFYLTALGIGINVDRFNRLFPGKPLPATWDDLLDKDFAGEIVLTDPVASSTAYLFVQAQLQRLGWDAGWEYLRALAPLVGQFPSSGGAPPQLVGTGEYAIGVAYVHALARYRNDGFPVSTIVPPATAGEVGAISIIANGPNPDNARLFVDFVLSAAAQEAFAAQSFTTPVNPAAVLPAGANSVSEFDLIDYDAELAGEQRDEVLLLWQQLVD